MLIPSSLMQSMASFRFPRMSVQATLKRAKIHVHRNRHWSDLRSPCLYPYLVKGDLLASFSTDAAVIQNGFAYLKGFAPETIVTAVLFSMIGYFNGNNKTLWVMLQGLIQTLCVRLLRLLHEYPAKRQPDKDRTCRTGFHNCRHPVERWILSLPEQERKTRLTARFFYHLIWNMRFFIWVAQLKQHLIKRIVCFLLQHRSNLRIASLPPRFLARRILFCCQTCIIAVDQLVSLCCNPFPDSAPHGTEIYYKEASAIAAIRRLDQ